MTKTELEKLDTLITERIRDLSYTVNNPAQLKAHQMSARARIDELEWVKDRIKDGHHVIK